MFSLTRKIIFLFSLVSATSSFAFSYRFNILRQYAYIANFGTYKAYSNGNYARSCREYIQYAQTYLNYSHSTGSGFFRIKPDSGTSPYDVYCNTTTFNYMQNGSFDNPSNLDGWVTDIGIMSYNSGYLINYSPNRGYTTTVKIKVAKNKKYTITFPVIENTSEYNPYPTYGQYFYIYGDAAQSILLYDEKRANNSSGTYSATVIAPSDTIMLYIHTQASYGYTKFDNVSIIEQP